MKTTSTKIATLGAAVGIVAALLAMSGALTPVFAATQHASSAAARHPSARRPSPASRSRKTITIASTQGHFYVVGDKSENGRHLQRRPRPDGVAATASITTGNLTSTGRHTPSRPGRPRWYLTRITWSDRGPPLRWNHVGSHHVRSVPDEGHCRWDLRRRVRDDVWRPAKRDDRVRDIPGWQHPGLERTRPPSFFLIWYESPARATSTRLRDAEFTQNLGRRGVIPSPKTWPRCEPHLCMDLGSFA